MQRMNDPLSPAPLWQALVREEVMGLLLRPDANDPDGLPRVNTLPLALSDCGQWLDAHLAARHADDLHPGRRVRVQFQGPHAYISPSVYNSRREVPTWNHLGVQIDGHIHLETEPAAAEALLMRLVAQVDPAYAAQWPELPPAQQQAKLGAIRCFRIRIESVRTHTKLSQRRPFSERRRMGDYLAERNPALLRWMDRLGLLTPGAGDEVAA